MNFFFRILFVVASVIYPIVVFSCLVVFHFPIKVFSLFVVFIALFYLLLATSGKDSFKNRIRKNLKLLISSGLLLTAGMICLLTGRTLFIKLYPVIMNVIFLFSFGSTLFVPPNICFRFACIPNKDLANSFIAGRVERYCWKVTVIWCAFFVLNGIAALFTVLSDDDKLWSIYNGGISYALMGALFAVEFLIRMVVNSKMPKSIPISKFDAKSRPMDTILCYENRWSDRKYRTWRDFLSDSAKIRKFIKSHDDIDKWILHSEDYWYFLCSLIALLQCGKEILLTANIAPNYIEEIRQNAKKSRFLTDQNITDSDFIFDILSSTDVDETEIMETPKIVADDTRIVMHTSGSTGKPKTVLQRMTEFEADNAFIISKWGEEFLSRKLCATVSQHHIYGFLFTICIPFTLGVPFRRFRIEIPEEFESLSDSQYMIIAVPAFLKRTCDAVKKLPLENPWIFTSGGAVSPELAISTENLFGFCPLEVYGSTETSGIAYRKQSKDGSVWTPFDNAKIWADENDGCLRIISPYIKDPNGFKTGDLVEIHDDGRFILKGRADSIVKIEEKRISLPEVELRLMQSELVSDCSVVPMISERRQYLAAAIVLNDAGKSKFADSEKFEINRYFHDYLMQFFENVVIPKKWRFMDSLPTDVQGKKHKPEIQALFN